MTIRASLLGAPLTCLLAGTPLAADITVHAYPPAYCAALWQGYADVLGDDGERGLADRFRDASVHLIGEAGTDAIIEERRPWIRDLMDAYIYAQDDQSRELFERLVTDCGQLEADLPHLRP